MSLRVAAALTLAGIILAESVVAPRDIELDGEAAAEGTVARLRLCGPVRVFGGAQP